MSVEEANQKVEGKAIAAIEKNVQREDDEVLHRDPSYFQYYTQLQHQQNMLQDYIRTSAYRSAIVGNKDTLFRDRLVMDVGSGSGILAFFAAQADARHIFAVEASGMAKKMKVILDAAKPDNGIEPRNAFLADRITVINSKIEEPRLLNLMPQVDVIISEPIGVLLVHERMLESYIYARDKFLRPGGAMMPSSGTIHLAPLTDATLWNETITKARFWQQRSFYDVDLNPYFATAFDEYFSAPVVGCFSPTSLMGPSAEHLVDFHTVSMADLKEFVIPIEWEIRYTGVMHGMAGWFDLTFYAQPSAQHPFTVAYPTLMSTSPYSPATHWQQVRLLLKQPLAVNAGQVIRGSISMRANDERSYDISGNFIVLDLEESAQLTDEELDELISAQKSRSRSAVWHLHEQVYNYSYIGETTEDPKPEALNLYMPVDSLLAESSANPELPSNAISSIQGVTDSLTDFIVTRSAASTNAPESRASNDASKDNRSEPTSAAMEL
ncbi:hypothetical protein GGI26_006088 [Coemansia sp. RSA 1358]|nr:hypothetical protein EDC05_003316 [Coemansia umbellata]KAJ2619123.1 hypothetical protein GGI26_006088 [Coemansia sp. RSA 1358]